MNFILSSIAGSIITDFLVCGLKVATYTDTHGLQNRYQLSKSQFRDVLLILMSERSFLWLARPLESLHTKHHHVILLKDGAGELWMAEFNVPFSGKSSSLGKSQARVQFIHLDTFLNSCSSVRVYRHENQSLNIWENLAKCVLFFPWDHIKNSNTIVRALCIMSLT
jgi:hypothetical protein